MKISKIQLIKKEVLFMHIGMELNETEEKNKKKETKATIRCIPRFKFKRKMCIDRKKSNQKVYFAKSY